MHNITVFFMFNFVKNLFKKKTYLNVPTGGNRMKYPNWKKAKYLTAYETSSYVNACVRKRAEKVGQIEFQLFKGDKEIPENKWIKLLNHPNSLMSKSEFFELYQIYKDLTGDAYIVVL